MCYWKCLSILNMLWITQNTGFCTKVTGNIIVYFLFSAKHSHTPITFKSGKKIILASLFFSSFAKTQLSAQCDHSIAIPSKTCFMKVFFLFVFTLMPVIRTSMLVFEYWLSNNERTIQKQIYQSHRLYSMLDLLRHFTIYLSWIFSQNENAVNNLSK